MLESQIIEVNGTFLGTIILEADRSTRRFYAAHESVKSLHNSKFAQTDDPVVSVAYVFRRGH
ncbi:hypothetical protein CSR02_14175 [Acetobacter pomorum]|uniref:Uncharacterized protein n=2 Tax=Acetobacter pomorum TaxID=65959 RepID=A0A2G4R8W6_9PROT|nr:hypothetical protein [Acetobacter pomorum]PHY92947.1 hypothetical protein CSR02_14175 [Acetobacter pomorum]